MLKRLSPDDKSKLALFAAFSVVLVAGLLWMAGLAPVKAQLTTTNLPVATLTTGITTGAAVQIAPANPTRRSYSICAGSAASLVVAPAPATPTSTNGLSIAASSCFTPPANLLASGTAAGGGAAWNGIGGSGTATAAFVEW